MTSNSKPLFNKKVRELSVEEMREVINSLSPKEEMHAGVQFLNKMLDESGVAGVIEFVEKGHKILDEEGKLLDYDFVTDLERRLLKKSHPNAMDRRTFLHTLGWGIAGGVGIPYYSSEIGNELWTHFVDKGVQKNNPFHRAHEWIGHYAVPPAELLISASLVNEMAVNWRETKLEEVSNAVAEAVDALRAIASKASPSKRSGRGE